MCRRTADRLVALVVPDDDEQVPGPLVGERGQDAEVEQQPAIGVERDDPSVRQPGRKPEGLRRHAAQLLLEQARRSHVRGRVVPLVDAAPEGEDDEFVAEPRGQRPHAVVARHHRTSLPPRTMAVW